MLRNTKTSEALSPVDAKKTLKEKLSSSIANIDIDGRRVIEKLFDAIDSGKILITKDGFLTIPDSPFSERSYCVFTKPSEGSPRKHYKSCKFLQGIAHKILYEEKYVPQGCQHCYKVKVEVSNVFSLKKLHEISKEIPWDSKCGTEVQSPYSQSVYVGFFYVDGLDQAYEAYDLINKTTSQHKDLINCNRISIKRGCTSYEIKLGSSKKWQFTSSSVEVEDELYSLFTPPQKTSIHKTMRFLNWIKVAFQIGDDSYLKLTNGKRLYPKMVDYSPKIQISTQHPPITAEAKEEH